MLEAKACHRRLSSAAERNEKPANEMLQPFSYVYDEDGVIVVEQREALWRCNFQHIFSFCLLSSLVFF